jgi:hypothetical protein
VSRAHTSILAFTEEAEGPGGEVITGLVATAGLETVVPGAFAVGLVSVDLQLVVAKESPKIKIPKMIE